jgi:hypothetical protein
MTICAILSGFYLTAMSVDRAIAVRFPMAVSTYCTTGRARKVVLVGTFIIGTAHGYLFHAFHYVKDADTGMFFIFRQTSSPISLLPYPGKHSIKDILTAKYFCWDAYVDQVDLILPFRVPVTLFNHQRLEGSKSNIHYCALIARQVRTTFASDSRM